MNATVKRSDLSTWKMVAGNEYHISVVIDRGVKREWVSIGWIDAGAATDEDKAKYPTVVEDTP